MFPATTGDVSNSSDPGGGKRVECVGDDIMGRRRDRISGDRVEMVWSGFKLPEQACYAKVARPESGWGSDSMVFFGI